MQNTIKAMIFNMRPVMNRFSSINSGIEHSGIWWLVIILPLACCIGGIVLLKSPIGLCLDFFSGRVPYEAQELFVQMTIEKILEEDYEWLVQVSDPEMAKLTNIAENAISLKPQMTPSYTIFSSDNLAGIYTFNIEFQNGKEAIIEFSGFWPQCPDFNVTEEEVFKHLKLFKVYIYN